MTGDPKRPRSLSLKPAERTMVREAAAAAGKGNSEYVLGLVAADDPERHPVVLTPDEQLELRDGLRELLQTVRERLGKSGPDAATAPRPAGAGAMRRARRRGGGKGGNHLSISARNAEWDEVRARAERAGLPIARYVKRLVERDLSGGGTGFTALAPEEQRELLEAMREIRALLREDAAMTMRDGETGGGRCNAACAEDEGTGGIGGAGRGAAAPGPLVLSPLPVAPAGSHERGERNDDCRERRQERTGRACCPIAGSGWRRLVEFVPKGDLQAAERYLEFLVGAEPGRSSDGKCA